MRAKVIGQTDGNQADRFEDEYGGQWRYFADAADGTIALSACDDMGNLANGTGVFRWEKSMDLGEIYRQDDGKTYGINCRDEFIVRNGEWVENSEGDNGH